MPFVKCLNCGKEFYVKPSWIKKGRGKYCSIKCKSEYWKKIGKYKGKNNPNAKIGRIKISKEIKDWIDGHLLGDARIGVARTSTYFEQGCSQKYKEYAKHLQKELESFGIETRIETRVVGESKSLNLPRHELIFVRTLYYREFWYFRNRFYPNGKKTVPRDIEITPTLVLNWYMDDGCLSKFSKGGWYRVRFAIPGFREEDVLYLQKALAKSLDVFVVIERNKNKPQHLSINREKDVRKFFRYIGDPPVKCFEYKWPPEL